MSVPKDYRCSESHEWVKMEDDNIATIGITDYAQDKLGEIVSVELPRVGDEVERGEPIGMIDSQKASTEVFAPISGVVLSDHVRNLDLAARRARRAGVAAPDVVAEVLAKLATLVT